MLTYINETWRPNIGSSQKGKLTILYHANSRDKRKLISKAKQLRSVREEKVKSGIL